MMTGIEGTDSLYTDLIRGAPLSIIDRLLEKAKLTRRLGDQLDLFEILVDHEQPDVRRKVAEVLGIVARRRTSAVETLLTRLAGDPVLEVQEAARLAFEALEARESTYTLDVREETS